MPGQPIFLSQVALQRVALHGSATTPGGPTQLPSDGRVAQQWDGILAMGVQADAAAAQPLISFGAPAHTLYDAWRPGPGCGAVRDSKATVGQAFDRVTVWVLSWKAPALATTAELSLRCGYDRGAEEQLRVQFTVGKLAFPGAPVLVAQVSGLLMDHVELWGRLVAGGDAKADVSTRVIFDRACSPFQLRWGNACTKIAPATANTLP